MGPRTCWQPAPDPVRRRRPAHPDRARRADRRPRRPSDDPRQGNLPTLFAQLKPCRGHRSRQGTAAAMSGTGKPVQVPDPRSWQPCVTPQSATTAPTSLVPADAPIGAHTTSSPPCLTSPIPERHDPGRLSGNPSPVYCRSAGCAMPPSGVKRSYRRWSLAIRYAGFFSLVASSLHRRPRDWPRTLADSRSTPRLSTPVTSSRPGPSFRPGLGTKSGSIRRPIY